MDRRSLAINQGLLQAVAPAGTPLCACGQGVWAEGLTGSKYASSTAHPTPHPTLSLPQTLPGMEWAQSSVSVIHHFGSNTPLGFLAEVCTGLWTICEGIITRSAWSRQAKCKPFLKHAMCFCCAVHEGSVSK